jgi:hypothetical protein
MKITAAEYPEIIYLFMAINVNKFVNLALKIR